MTAKKVFLFILFLLVVGALLIYSGFRDLEKIERQQTALSALVCSDLCFNRCNSYNNGCHDACGEDAACQERCRVKDQICINHCRR